MSGVASVPKTLLHILTDSLRAIEEYRRDPAVTKEDVLDSLESRLCIAMSKMISTPTATSYSMFRETQPSI